MSITIRGSHFVIVFLISLVVCIGIGSAWLYLMSGGRIFSYQNEGYLGLVVLFAGFMFLTPSLILTLILYGIFHIVSDSEKD